MSLDMKYIMSLDIKHLFRNNTYMLNLVINKISNSYSISILTLINFI